ncbi:unnamed protein product, partial [Microthlaspi erraticum]
KSPGLVGHSAPLTGWNQERNSATVAPPSSSNIVASPLPVPPLVVPRSFSIPSSHQRAFSSQRPVERNDDTVAASPPLTPMSLSRPLPQAAGVAQTSQIRDIRGGYRGSREERRISSSSSMDISASASLTSSGFVPRLLPLFNPLTRTISCSALLSSSSSSVRLISSHRRIAPSLCVSDQSASTGINVVDSDPVDTVKRKAMDIAPQLKGASIFLVGINNPVKTNLGKLLADSLRYYYFDSDNLIAEAAGGNVSAQALKEADEKAFQESETEVLRQLTSMGRLVVCAGDGAVQGLKNLALLRHGISIWIDVPLDIAAKGNDSFNSEPIPELFESLKASYEKSRNGYDTADASISLERVATKLGCDDLETVTSEDIALEVLKEIEKLTRVKKMMEEASRPF